MFEVLNYKTLIHNFDKENKIKVKINHFKLKGFNNFFSYKIGLVF